MIRFKKPYLFVILGLIVPVCGSAANFCIRVNGGFGNGGTSFMEKALRCRRRASADRGRASRRRLPPSS